MFHLIYNPRWFFGKDIYVDLVSVIVLFMIAFFSYRYYGLSKRKKYAIFSTSFLLMAVSFIFKIVTNFTLYHQKLETKTFGLITYTYSTLQQSDILFQLGFLFHRLLMLFGLYLLYSIYAKPKKGTSFLIFYLIVVSTIFMRSAYFIFHLSSLILLILISLYYIKNYKKSYNNKLLFTSFLTIILSQLLFMFIKFDLTLYIVAEFVQLLAYIVLLITIIRVLKDGKKRKK